LSPTPPTALRTASSGVLPPPDPLLAPFELGDFAFDFGFEPDDFGFDFEPDDLAFGFEADDFGFAFFAALGFADFDLEALGFEALGLAFDFDCVFGFDLADALFDADCFLDLVSAIFLSPRGCSLLGQVPNPLSANHAECG
jgi:hypothetical protein